MKKSTTLSLSIVASVMAVTLFHVKYQVLNLEKERLTINRKMVSNKEAIHVLNAEWAHLNNPQKLTQLNAKHLKLKPPRHAQFMSSKTTGKKLGQHINYTINHRR